MGCLPESKPSSYRTDLGYLILLNNRLVKSLIALFSRETQTSSSEALPQVYILMLE